MCHIHFVLFPIQIHCQGPEDCPQEKKEEFKIKRGGGEGGCVRIGLKELPLANLYVFLKICVYKGICNRGHKSGPCFINIGHKNQNRLNNKNTISIWI